MRLRPLTALPVHALSGDLPVASARQLPSDSLVTVDFAGLFCFGLAIRQTSAG